MSWVARSGGCNGEIGDSDRDIRSFPGARGRRRTLETAAAAFPTYGSSIETCWIALPGIAILADALATLAGRPPVNLLALILVRRGRDVVCGA
jgi:hypothetical protein